MVFEVVAGGPGVATTTGRQLPAAISGTPSHTFRWPSRMRRSSVFATPAPGAAIADALHVRSAARYNDGSLARVTLEPMDGIVLARN